jgi:hypothetical protein
LFHTDHDRLGIKLRLLSAPVVLLIPCLLERRARAARRQAHDHERGHSAHYRKTLRQCRQPTVAGRLGEMREWRERWPRLAPQRLHGQLHGLQGGLPVAVCQFLEGCPLNATAARLCFLHVGKFGGRPMCCPRAFARLRPPAVRVRIRSRSTSASPPRTAIISRPVLVAVSAHGSASELNWPPAARISLRMANRSKVERAGRSIRVTITTSPRVRPLSN